MSDYVPLEKDIGVLGRRRRTFEGPLKFSATVFTEEEKAWMRSWSTRRNISTALPEVQMRFRRETLALIEKLREEHRGYDVLHLAELICREEGR